MSQDGTKGLHFDIDRAKLVSGMQMSEGWKLLEQELRKMTDSMKQEAVSSKYLNDPQGYASIVGAHNAIQSLLNLLEGIKVKGDRAERLIKERDNKTQEEREIEAAVGRIG